LGGAAVIAPYLPAVSAPERPAERQRMLQNPVFCLKKAKNRIYNRGETDNTTFCGNIHIKNNIKYYVNLRVDILILLTHYVNLWII